MLTAIPPITEQGFGDVLQFIRYAPMSKAEGGRVIFECPEKLIKLVTGLPRASTS